MALRGLAGKCAVVTGGAQGLGAAIAARLLDEGGRVVVADVDRSALDSLPRHDALHAVDADASSEAGAETYVAAALERFGALDLFVNNAAILGRWQPIAETSVEDFDRLHSINVRGVFIGLRAAIRQMTKQGRGGSIVNVASLAAERASAGRALYGSAKRAVVGLAKSAALEAAGASIRINCVAPGMIDTRMGREGRNRQDEHGARIPLASRPIPRMAGPGEIAGLVAWLLSDEASYVTGAVYAIDGGASA
jgi:NAD(P)-dependent dehydrogenase (short-subunit alcohol dehydrogenase family)